MARCAARAATVLNRKRRSWARRPGSGA